MARILIFGDSATYGTLDIARGGWVDRLKSFCMEKKIENPKFGYSIYNLGISGDTSDDVLKRLENEINCRIWKNKEVIIIFAIGINDSCFVKSKNIFLTTENGFKKNIQKLIKLSEKYSSKIIFVGLTPVEESKTNPISWSTTGKSYKNKYIKRYDSIIKSVCQENNIYFIDMLEEFNKIDYQKLLEDGGHPNSEGHQKMFEIVKGFLMEEGIIGK